MNQQRMLFDTVTDWCDRNDWSYDVVEEGAAIRSGFSGDNGRFPLYITVSRDRLMVRSLAPINTPAAKRAVMAEFLTRANYGMAIGNFEMDYNDGEIAYKTSITSGGQTISDRMIQDLVFINCLMMDKYFPGMMQVLYSGVDPEAAVAALEG
ncbi:MAG TPA: YbjN domain-containing protein [Firmicutes bacterium]|jgi:hypothetical protein|nr:YbjN domain-containing protein [Bacillota bacterium]